MTELLQDIVSMISRSQNMYTLVGGGRNRISSSTLNSSLNMTNQYLNLELHADILHEARAINGQSSTAT
jgi:hypothetical protein